MVASVVRIISVLNLFSNAMLVCRCCKQYLNFNISDASHYTFILSCIMAAADPSVHWRSKAWVHGHLLTWIAVSNPAGGMDASLVSVVYCQVEVSASGRSLIQRSPTKCQVCLSVIVKPL
jgi:predicted NAD/FAD-dependent oxidoreductase